MHPGLPNRPKRWLKKTSNPRRTSEISPETASAVFSLPCVSALMNAQRADPSFQFRLHVGVGHQARQPVRPVIVDRLGPLPEEPQAHFPGGHPGDVLRPDDDPHPGDGLPFAVGRLGDLLLRDLDVAGFVQPSALGR